LSRFFCCSKKRKLTLKEINEISPLEEDRMPYRVKARLAEEKFVMQNRDVLSQVLESGYRFTLGSIAGGLKIEKLVQMFFGVKHFFVSYSDRCVCCLSD
jgi:hypothetical protein